jgi:hypothetical protein
MHDLEELLVTLETPKPFDPSEYKLNKDQLYRALISYKAGRDIGKWGNPGYLRLYEDKFLEDFIIAKSEKGISFTYEEISKMVFKILVFPHVFSIFFFQTRHIESSRIGKTTTKQSTL